MEGKLILVVPSQSRADRSNPPSLHDSPIYCTTPPFLCCVLCCTRSPEVVSSSRDGVDGTLQVLWSWENAVMVDDDRFNELIDAGLARDLVIAFWDRHQRGAETDGQVVGVHHVLLTVLGQAGRLERSSLEGNLT